MTGFGNRLYPMFWDMRIKFTQGKSSLNNFLSKVRNLEKKKRKGFWLLPSLSLVRGGGEGLGLSLVSVAVTGVSWAQIRIGFPRELQLGRGRFRY